MICCLPLRQELRDYRESASRRRNMKSDARAVRSPASDAIAGVDGCALAVAATRRGLASC
jgi:hypothetical protein